MRSRSVSEIVLSAIVDVPAAPAWLVADWERDISQRLGLEPGDVEPLPLARTRSRWPDYRRCTQAACGWACALGLHEAMVASDVALMACRGARYHHDGLQYGDAAFCNVFLSEDKGLDVHFPVTGHRIPLVRGTVLLFDTGQPHAVIQRRSHGFSVAEFAADQDCTQVFLSWELPIENTEVARALGIEFDIEPSIALRGDEDQVWRHGGPALVCPESGRWCDW